MYGKTFPPLSAFWVSVISSIYISEVDFKKKEKKKFTPAITHEKLFLPSFI